MNLEGFGFLFLTIMRWMMGRTRRRPMGHNGLAVSLGRSSTIVPKLGGLLARGIHEPEIDRYKND
jgi:hypothetical protein